MLTLVLALSLSSPPVDVDPIVVSGTRRPLPALEVPRSVSVVTSEEVVEAQPDATIDLLEAAPGVFAQRTHRGAGAPILRGLVGPQNLTLVDGIRLTTSTWRTGPNQYVNLVPTLGLERLEVVLGPSGTLLGNGAMGGTISAWSLEPGESPVSGWAAGRFRMADLGGGLAATATGTLGPAGYVAHAVFDQGNGLRLGGGDELPVSLLNTGQWQAKGAFALSDALTLRLALLGALIDEAGRADDLGKGDLRFYDNVDHLAYARLTYEGSMVRSGSATLSYHRMEERVRRFSCAVGSNKVVLDRAACLDREADAVTRESRTEDTVDVLGGTLDAAFDLWDERIRLTAGLETQVEWVGSEQQEAKRGDDGVLGAFADKARGTFSDGSRWIGVGAYSHASVTAWQGEELRAVVSGGLRVSHVTAHAPGVPDLGDVDYDFTGVSGSAGVALLAPGLLDVYLTFDQGFRAPNLQETTALGDTGSRLEVPNPDLEPERSHALELGAKLRFSKVRLTAAWHYTWLDGLITDSPTTYEGAETHGESAKPVSHRVNSEDGHLQGIDLAVEADFWHFTTRYAVSWLTGEITAADGDDVPPRRLPPIFGSAALRYRLNPEAFMELGVDFAGAQDALNPADRKDARICETGPYSGLLQSDCVGTPGWYAVNLLVGWQAAPWVRLDAGLWNLLDTKYRRHGSGHDAAGIDARFTVTGSF